VLRRPFDGRTGTGLKKTEGANTVPVYTGATPYKVSFYLPVTDAPTVGATVDGNPVDAGAPFVVAEGAQHAFALTGLPAGSTVQWSEVGPADAQPQADGSLNVTFRTV